MLHVSPSRTRAIASHLAIGIAALAIAALHLWILVGQLASGELFEPLVALRWLASGLLVAIGWRLRRAGLSLLRGRAALVLWLMVALLHATLATPAEVAVWSFEVALSLVLLGVAALLAEQLAASLKPSFPEPLRSVALRPQRGHLRASAGRAPPLH